MDNLHEEQVLVRLEPEVVRSALRMRARADPEVVPRELCRGGGPGEKAAAVLAERTLAVRGAVDPALDLPLVRSEREAVRGDDGPADVGEAAEERRALAAEDQLRDLDVPLLEEGRDAFDDFNAYARLRGEGQREHIRGDVQGG